MFGPRIGWPMDRDAAIGRVLAAVGPHPDLGKPRLWTMGVKDPAVRGFALGVAAHGLGTARAFQISEETGAFSALAMCLNGIVTALLLPALFAALGG